MFKYLVTLLLVPSMAVGQFTVTNKMPKFAVTNRCPPRQPTSVQSAIQYWTVNYHPSIAGYSTTCVNGQCLTTRIR